VRWTEFAASLSPEACERLANALTLGCGHAAVAVRLLVRDAEMVQVVEAAAFAYSSLVTARRLLSPASDPQLDDPVAAECEPSTERWHAFLATRPPEDAAVLIALLRETLVRARQAAEAVIADAEVEPIRLHLVAAAASLADARRLMTTGLAS
jgi:hypothetical protein